jgi:hypothetical protein
VKQEAVLTKKLEALGHQTKHTGSVLVLKTLVLKEPLEKALENWRRQ